MSHVHAASSKPASKVAHLATALRTSWTRARQTDRELMALRTHLSRHSG